MGRHSYEGPVTLSYRLQPMWYDHEFSGFPYEVEKMIEALDLIGGKVYRVTYRERNKCGCGCEQHATATVDVTKEFYPVPVEFSAPLV